MKCTRLYTAADGTSAFEDLSFLLELDGPELSIACTSPKGMLLNETRAGHRYDWHNAPQKQWVITLQGEIEVVLRNGVKKTFGAGSIILAEDTTGSGHATTVVSAVPWRCAYLPFDGPIGKFLGS